MSPRYLLFLGCAALVWAEDPDWPWPCEPVTIQEGVDISKVTTSWLLAELIPNQGKNGTDMCVFTDIVRTGDSSILQYQQHEKEEGRPVVIENIEIQLLSPSRWRMKDSLGSNIPAVVVDLPEDGRSLAITACVSLPDRDHHMTFVLTKDADVDLGALNARIEVAGVLGIEDANMFNTNDCFTER